MFSFCDMEYITEITIDKPLSEVMELFKNPNNLKMWQSGLQSTKLLKGKSGEKDAKRKVKINIEGRQITMIETITKCDLPHHWHARYTTNNMRSFQENYFEAINQYQTYWKTKSRFEFQGYMRIVGRVLPGIFKRRSETVMKDFKAFAERNISVQD